MIDLHTLTLKDIGRFVLYRNDDKSMLEIGRLKSWNEHYIFVVYKCDGRWDDFKDFTAASTKPEDLIFVEDK